MKSISDIFFNGISDKHDINIIKKVNVPIDSHYIGILNIAKSIEPGFVINENNEGIIKQLLLYFTGNEDFKGSLKKGLMIVGSVGTGKSLLFRIFKAYTGKILRVNSFQYHTSSEIIDNVNINGVEFLEKYNHNFDNPITCYIDDIASRNEVIKYFGTEVNVMEQLISIRYNIYERYKKLTHISSNKYPNDFKDLYDERVIDRMKQMFNVIELSGNSFRK